MKARPILFSTPMVQALLEGRKTQTRRIIGKLHGREVVDLKEFYDDEEENGFSGGFSDLNNWGYPNMIEFDPYTLQDMLDYNLCPYGKVGDLLWVRETWQAFKQVSYEYDEWAELESIKDMNDNVYEPVYKANNENFPEKWFPSIFMPKQYSRLTLEITNIRVERLQDISRGDCMAEGCPFPNIAKETSPVKWYRELWQSLNGKDSWDKNPWVWVIEFKIHKCNFQELNKKDS